jgi:hypothetical protein
MFNRIYKFLAKERLLPCAKSVCVFILVFSAITYAWVSGYGAHARQETECLNKWAIK